MQVSSSAVGRVLRAAGRWRKKRENMLTGFCFNDKNKLVAGFCVSLTLTKEDVMATTKKPAAKKPAAKKPAVKKTAAKKTGCR